MAAQWDACCGARGRRGGKRSPVSRSGRRNSSQPGRQYLQPLPRGSSQQRRRRQLTCSPASGSLKKGALRCGNSPACPPCPCSRAGRPGGAQGGEHSHTLAHAAQLQAAQAVQPRASSPLPDPESESAASAASALVLTLHHLCTAQATVPLSVAAALPPQPGLRCPSAAPTARPALPEPAGQAGLLPGRPPAHLRAGQARPRRSRCSPAGRGSTARRLGAWAAMQGCCALGRCSPPPPPVSKPHLNDALRNLHVQPAQHCRAGQAGRGGGASGTASRRAAAREPPGAGRPPAVPPPAPSVRPPQPPPPPAASAPHLRQCRAESREWAWAPVSSPAAVQEPRSLGLAGRPWPLALGWPQPQHPALLRAQGVSGGAGWAPPASPHHCVLRVLAVADADGPRSPLSGAGGAGLGAAGGRAGGAKGGAVRWARPGLRGPRPSRRPRACAVSSGAGATWGGANRRSRPKAVPIAAAATPAVHQVLAHAIQQRVGRPIAQLGP